MNEQSETSVNGDTGKGALMAAVPEGELFTLKEVAAWAKITVSMVRAMIHRGELHAIKIGRLWRVRREDLDKFIARQPHVVRSPSEVDIC